jgi:predicted nuclease with TOPRIM domain
MKQKELWIIIDNKQRQISELQTENHHLLDSLIELQTENHHLLTSLTELQTENQRLKEMLDEIEYGTIF